MLHHGLWCDLTTIARRDANTSNRTISYDTIRDPRRVTTYTRPLVAQLLPAVAQGLGRIVVYLDGAAAGYSVAA